MGLGGQKVLPKMARLRVVQAHWQSVLWCYLGGLYDNFHITSAAWRMTFWPACHFFGVGTCTAGQCHRGFRSPKRAGLQPHSSHRAPSPIAMHQLSVEPVKTEVFPSTRCHVKAQVFPSTLALQDSCFIRYPPKQNPARGRAWGGWGS